MSAEGRERQPSDAQGSDETTPRSRAAATLAHAAKALRTRGVGCLRCQPSLNKEQGGKVNKAIGIEQWQIAAHQEDMDDKTRSLAAAAYPESTLNCGPQMDRRNGQWLAIVLGQYSRLMALDFDRALPKERQIALVDKIKAVLDRYGVFYLVERTPNGFHLYLTCTLHCATDVLKKHLGRKQVLTALPKGSDRAHPTSRPVLVEALQGKRYIYTMPSPGYAGIGWEGWTEELVGRLFDEGISIEALREILELIEVDLADLTGEHRADVPPTRVVQGDGSSSDPISALSSHSQIMEASPNQGRGGLLDDSIAADQPRQTLANAADYRDHPRAIWANTVTCAHLLHQEGWELVKEEGRDCYWRRPGSENSHGAITRNVDSTGGRPTRNKVFNFSTSAGFDTLEDRGNAPMDSFELLTQMTFSGDATAADNWVRSESGMGGNRPVRGINSIFSIVKNGIDGDDKVELKPCPGYLLKPVARLLAEGVAKKRLADPLMGYNAVLCAYSAAIGASVVADLDISSGGIIQGYSPDCFPLSYSILILAGSGSAKTSLVNSAFRPILMRHEVMTKEWALEVGAFHREEAFFKEDVKEWKKAKSQRGPEPKPPVKPRKRGCYLGEGTSPQALYRLLVDNPRGTGVIIDELPNMIESEGAERLNTHYFLWKAGATLGSGVKELVGDGVLDTESRMVLSHACATLCLGAQTERFYSLVLPQAEFRFGGLTGRLTVVKSTFVPPKGATRQRLDPCIQKNWETELNRVMSIRADNYNRKLDAEPYLPVTVSLSDGARSLHEEFEDRMDFMGWKEQVQEPFRSYLTRASIQTVSIAGIIAIMWETCPDPALVEGWPRELILTEEHLRFSASEGFENDVCGIPAWAMAMAIHWMEWALESTQDTLCQGMEELTYEKFRRIAIFMESNAPRNGKFWTRSDLMKRCRAAEVRRNDKSETILDEMEAQGWIKTTEKGKARAVELLREIRGQA